MTSKMPSIVNGILFQVTEKSSDGKIKLLKGCVCPDSKPSLNSNFVLRSKQNHSAEATEFEKSKKCTSGQFLENTQNNVNY